MLRALRDGFSSLALNWGLVLLVLATNLAVALTLAVPLAVQLRGDLAHTGTSGTMMYDFDYDWWSGWSREQEGPSRNLGPDLLGTGFVYKSLDALLAGRLPAGLFPDASAEDDEESSGAPKPVPDIDPTILGLAALYLIVQVLLLGGILGVLRAPRGGWTVRGLAHGAGFYAGRMLRVSILSLAGAFLVFFLNLRAAAWADDLVREVVSERTALTLLLGRPALLLAALLLVHMVASYARVILVVEERRSALLAFVSSLGFCLRNLLAAVGQYVVLFVALLVLLWLWGAIDVRLAVTGWKSQLVALVLMEALIGGRIALRLGLLASQLELYRARSRREPDPAAAEAVPTESPEAEAA